MKPDSLLPPGDAAADPLLAALGKQLGTYGQDPPPGAWAAIRQQLAPPPAPRPWWRSRRLVVLLGLLLGLLLSSLLVKQSLNLTHRGAGQLSGSRPVAGERATHPAGSPHASDAPSHAQPQLAIRIPKASTFTKTPVGAGVATETGAPASTSETASATGRHRVATPHSPGYAATLPGSLATAEEQERRHPRAKQLITLQAATTSKQLLTLAEKTTLTAEKAHHYGNGVPADAKRATSSVAHRLRGQYQRNSIEQPARETPAVVLSRSVASYSTAPPASSLPAGPVDLLAESQPKLLLLTPVLPATVVARPDSGKPTHPVRRWSLLVVGGPTLSYRTLGPAPTLAANHPNFAQLERPALGWGAQVQVRRVLSGRWALAAGLGYHEYATRLALTLKDSAYSVHQRDTYRLLTVPVQLSYAVGAPTGKLTTALLLGAEPGWYLGGRSTEGADCGCHQQVYTSTGSPYRPWSLAFSLGLDLRWQLGGAGSRWRWVVQPTGRYVATPFVQSTAVGFTRRQPFSLGLLTGFSWEVR